MYVDADFSGNWDAKEALNGRDTARSRHSYIISYTGCPIVWKLKLQTEVCLSSTESEYTGLSHSLRRAISIIILISPYAVGSLDPFMYEKLKLLPEENVNVAPSLVRVKLLPLSCTK